MKSLVVSMKSTIYWIVFILFECINLLLAFVIGAPIVRAGYGAFVFCMLFMLGGSFFLSEALSKGTITTFQWGVSKCSDFSFWPILCISVLIVLFSLCVPWLRVW